MNFVLFAIISLFMYPTAKAPTATTYYVKTGGNNSNTGTSDLQAWGNLNAVNGRTFQPGDQILFKAGDTFYGTIVATSSGSVGNPVKYGTYGTGPKARITGLNTITNWSTTGTPNVYRAPVANGGQMVHVLLVDGDWKAKGRFPKMTPGYGGLMTVDSRATNSITSSALLNRNYTGGEVVARTWHHRNDRWTITSHNGSTINFVETGEGWHTGNGFFVQNHPSTLTSQFDWWYDKTGGFVYIYLNQAPSNYTIQVSNGPTSLFTLSDKDDVEVNGLDFYGCNGDAVVLDNAYRLNGGGIIARNNNVRFAAGIGIRPVFANFNANGTRGYLIEDNTVEDCQEGIISFYHAHYSTIQRNTVRNMGLLPGNGTTGSGGGGIAVSLANFTNVTDNRLDNLGYCPVTSLGSNQYIARNYITNGNLVLDDGGGIYFQRRGNDWQSYGPCIVEDNVIVNMAGNSNGISNGEAWGDMYYTDDRVTKVTIRRNSGSGASRHGIYLHTNQNITVTQNTIYNAFHQMAVEPNAAEFPTIYSTGMTITDNTFILGPNSNQYLWLLRSDNGPDNRDILGTVNNNKYYQPTLTAQKFYTSYKDASNNLQIQVLNFTGFKTVAGANYEANGTNNAFTASGTTRFEFNETANPKTISLPGTYTSTSGTAYNNGSITLQPYTSAVLAKTGDISNPTAQTMTLKQISMNQATSRFYESLPIDYATNPTAKYPVIIYHHGSGEIGQLQPATGMLANEIPKLINAGTFPSSFTVNGQTFRFIVIMPHWNYWPQATDIQQVVNYVVNNYRVDTSRIYMTGLSMGGGMTWDYASANATYANRLAAIVPVAGNMNAEAARVTTLYNTNLPIWAFHNQDDASVSPAFTNNWVNQYNAKSPAPVPLARKTTPLTGGHNAWTLAYNPDYRENSMNIYEWMLQYTNTGAITPPPPPPPPPPPGGGGKLPKGRKKTTLKVSSAP